jgi:hypothetical protein
MSSNKKPWLGFDPSGSGKEAAVTKTEPGPKWSWNPFSNVDKGLTWEGVGQFLTQGPWDIPGHIRKGVDDLFKDDDPPKSKPSGDSNKGGSTGENSHQPPPAKNGGSSGQGGRIDNSGSGNAKGSEMKQWFADNGPLLLGAGAVGLLLLAFIFKAIRR